MSHASDVIRPQVRRRLQQAAADAPTNRAVHSTRILIRVPAVSVAGTSNTTRDTTVNAGTGSAPPDARKPELRIDAAHTTPPAPNFAAPAWLQPRTGLLASVLQRRSMLAIALIAAGVIGLVLANARSQRESTEGKSNSQTNTVKNGSREDVKHKEPVGENVTRTVKSATAPVQTVSAETAPSARLIGAKSSNVDNAAVEPALSTGLETTRTEFPGSLGGGTWRWPAASNAPASLTPDRPCIPPTGKPSGDPSAASNIIPNMPNYQQPQSMLLQSEMPGAVDPGLNGAAFRGSIDKLPSNVTR